MGKNIRHNYYKIITNKIYFLYFKIRYHKQYKKIKNSSDRYIY